MGSFLVALAFLKDKKGNKNASPLKGEVAPQGSEGVKKIIRLLIEVRGTGQISVGRYLWITRTSLVMTG